VPRYRHLAEGIESPVPRAHADPVPVILGFRRA
jgi:hypothetical protein